MLGFLFTLKMEVIRSFETRAFPEVRCGATHKTVLFIGRAVRTSNTTREYKIMKPDLFVLSPIKYPDAIIAMHTLHEAGFIQIKEIQQK
jgi:hypothetical protein